LFCLSGFARRVRQSTGIVKLFSIATQVERINADQYREFDPLTQFGWEVAIYHPQPPVREGWDTTTGINVLGLRLIRAAIPEWDGDLLSWQALPMGIVVKLGVTVRIETKTGKHWVNTTFIGSRAHLEEGEESNALEDLKESRARIELAQAERAAQALRQHHHLPDPENDAKTWNQQLWAQFQKCLHSAGVTTDYKAVSATWHNMCIGLNITMGSSREEWEAGIAAVSQPMSADHPVARAWREVQIPRHPGAMIPAKPTAASMAAAAARHAAGQQGD
jgi:hypothetical protein